MLGKLTRKDVGRLREELRKGFADGFALATAGRRLAATTHYRQAQGASFIPYLAAREARPRLRLCVLLWQGDPSPDAVAQWEELAADGHEVTAMGPGTGLRLTVLFSRGVWWHRLPWWWSLFPGGEARALSAELRRVGPRRGFTHICLMAPSRALERLAAESGLQYFALKARPAP